MRDDDDDDDDEEVEGGIAAAAAIDGGSRLLALTRRCRRLCGWRCCSGFTGAETHCLQVDATGRGRMAFQRVREARELRERERKKGTKTV